MCCGNKALTVFAYHVLTDVSGARDVNNIRCSQMRLSPLLLMERIRNWLNLCLKHCRVEAIREGSAGFHSHASLCFSLLNFSSSILILFSYQYQVFLNVCALLPPDFCHRRCHSACHQWPASPSPCLSLSVSFHLRVIIFRRRRGWKRIGSEGPLKRKEKKGNAQRRRRTV